MSASASAGTPDVRPWSVTTVIPTFDAASSLASTLDALTALDVPSGGTLEIVVSDDGSTDGTIEVVSGYRNVRLVRGERSGPAGARNRGAEASSGEILAFVDSGDVPSEPWLRQIVATFQDPRVGIASWPAWVVDAALGREQLVRTGAGPDGMVALATCFALRRSVFDAVGGYDADLRCGENSDLCERAAFFCRAHGRRLVSADQAAARVVFGRPPAYYDRPRLDAAEHLLRRDADQLAVEPPRAVRLHAIAAVNATRCGEWSRARTHAWAALRHGRSHRDLARAIVTLVPPLAERVWSSARRARVGAASFASPERAEGGRDPAGGREHAGGMSSSLKAARLSLENRARSLTTARDERAVASSLRERWLAVPTTVDSIWLERLARDRIEVVPWLEATRSLRDVDILEIGCGTGASTFALCEQGARVTAVDVDQSKIDEARLHLEGTGLHADFLCANGADAGHDEGVDFAWVIFWASLEHMLLDERVAALRAAWDLLSPGGLVTVIETPNRLWPVDSHTSQLPFFSWLPDALAFDYATFSHRPTFGGCVYTDPASQMLGFLRRGRGVSFHEFDLAIGDHRRLEVRSCMQLHRRAANPARRVGWALSTAGRTERALRQYAPSTHRAWFQPFLYLTLAKERADSDVRHADRAAQ